MGLSYEQAKAVGLGALHPAARGRAAGPIYAAPGPRPRPAPPDDGLNGLERAFRDEVLEPAYVRGDLVGFEREPIKFRLGGGCYYTPDFVAAHRPGQHGLYPWFTCIEVKGGFFRDDAKVKIKVAADKYPSYEWLLAYRDGKDGWRVHRVDRRGIDRVPVVIPWINGV